jgi:2-isopropylmalate synthase
LKAHCLLVLQGIIEVTDLKRIFRSCRITENEGTRSQGSSTSRIKAAISADGAGMTVTGSGNGPIDAFSKALRRDLAMDFDLLNYAEHALSQGSDSRAVAYVQLEDSGGRQLWGVSSDTNIDVASFKAILSALNRMAAKGCVLLTGTDQV